jgi:hypothetical protein
MTRSTRVRREVRKGGEEPGGALADRVAADLGVVAAGVVDDRILGEDRSHRVRVVGVPRRVRGVVHFQGPRSVIDHRLTLRRRA